MVGNTMPPVRTLNKRFMGVLFRWLDANEILEGLNSVVFRLNSLCEPEGEPSMYLCTEFAYGTGENPVQAIKELADAFGASVSCIDESEGATTLSVEVDTYNMSDDELESMVKQMSHAVKEKGLDKYWVHVS